MKSIKYILLAIIAVIATTDIHAKGVVAPEVYMFGFSASFQDSTIYITDIQEMKGVWIDKKHKFLLGRENYSMQLKNYLSDKLQLPNRVCIVFYAQNKKKAVKQMEKLKKKYVLKTKGTYDVHYITSADFKFETVDMSSEQQ